MKILFLLSLLFTAHLSANPDKTSVNTILDQLHHSASKADGKIYFSLFSEKAVFIGTDPTETWSIYEFEDFALPYFNNGTGWTYHPRNRHIYFSESAKTVWFDEMLDNDKYGETRGTGVLVKTDRGWKIAQYHLSIPIQNSLTNDIIPFRYALWNHFNSGFANEEKHF